MTSSDLKILHYYPSWLPQTQTWMYTLVKELNKNVDSHIVCENTMCSDQFTLPRTHVASNLYGKRYKFEAALRDVRIFKQLPCIYKLVKQLKPSLIHSHFGNYGWINTHLTDKYRIPHIISFYGADASLLPASRPVWYARYRHLFAKCDRILVEGPKMAERIASLGCREEKITIQKIGVYVKSIDFSPRNWQKGDTLRVLIAASFRQKKGIPTAIKALEKIKSEWPIELILIGDAGKDMETINEKSKILALLKETGLSSITQNLGFIKYEQIFEISRSCHLFLHTSQTAENGDNEGGSPVILTEMAASGIPIVSTFHCDIPEVILHERTGYLAREGDVEDVVCQIRKWLQSPDKWQEMLFAGRNHILKNYNIVTQAEKLLNVYIDECNK